MPNTKLLAGVELGGTKCVCILGTGPDDVRAVERLPTGEREETLHQVEAVLERWRQQHGAPRALGIASFGPVDLRPDSPTHGYITSTSKPGWRDTDVARRLARRLGVPMGVDTDVNGAALAEGRWGAARGLDDFAYVTVGTGIGVGSIVRGRSVVPVAGGSAAGLATRDRLRRSAARASATTRSTGSSTSTLRSVGTRKPAVPEPTNRLVDLSVPGSTT
jgi:fructokinase